MGVSKAGILGERRGFEIDEVTLCPGFWGPSQFRPVVLGWLSIMPLFALRKGPGSQINYVIALEQDKILLKEPR